MMLPFLLSVGFSSTFYVMAPLDILDSNQNINNKPRLEGWLQKLRDAKVDGIMIDVWWGLCEKTAKSYSFTGYTALFTLFQNYGLKIIPVMSFHQCGGNVGDECNIQLPSFVLNAQAQPFWKDSLGNINKEYMSIAFDSVNVGGRTPLSMYEGFMKAFNSQFQSLISKGVIPEIEVGLGPAGELRYPSYQLKYWSYPGCGVFQSYDSTFVSQLVSAAKAAGKSDYGRNPNNAGGYNVAPGGSEFWRDDGQNSWKTDYGQWFIKWYSQQLIQHGRNVLKAARSAFGSAHISGKIAGIHWWYDTSSHCAETTAGFNNFYFYDGYRDILAMFKEFNADVCFTCLEMEKGGSGSNPPALVNQVLNAAKWAGIKFEGENALPIYDDGNYGRVVAWAKKGLSVFTYLRLCSQLIDNNDNYNRFKNFVNNIRSA